MMDPDDAELASVGDGANLPALPLEIIDQIILHIAGAYDAKPTLGGMRLVNRAWEAIVSRYYFRNLNFRLNCEDVMRLDFVANSKHALHARHLRLRYPREGEFTDEHMRPSTLSKMTASVRASFGKLQAISHLGLWLNDWLDWPFEKDAEPDDAYKCIFGKAFVNTDMQHIRKLDLVVMSPYYMEELLLDFERPGNIDWWVNVCTRVTDLTLQILEEGQKIPEQILARTVSRFTRLEHLNSTYATFRDSQPHLSPHVSNLRSMVFTERVTLDASSFCKFIASNRSTLQRIDMYGFDIDSGVWQTVFEELGNCPNLVQLDMSFCGYWHDGRSTKWYVSDAPTEPAFGKRQAHFASLRHADKYALRDLAVVVETNRLRAGLLATVDGGEKQFGPRWPLLIRDFCSFEQYCTSPATKRKREEDAARERDDPIPQQQL